MKLSRLATLVALIGLVVVAAPYSTSGGRPFHVALDGASEVQPGDPDGSGEAMIRVNPGRDEIEFTLSVENIEPATAAHIHKAPAGSNGPAVVPLSAPTSGSSSGIVEVDRELALDIVRNPDQYYVNVHNAEYPPGAVRGQLGR